MVHPEYHKGEIYIASLIVTIHFRGPVAIPIHFEDGYFFISSFQKNMNSLTNGSGQAVGDFENKRFTCIIHLLEYYAGKTSGF